MDFTGKSIRPALNEGVMKKLLWVTLIGFFLLGLPIRAMSKDTGHGQANEKLKKTEQFPRILAQKMRLQKLRQSEKYKGMDFDRLKSLPPEGIDSMIKKYQPGKDPRPAGTPASIKSAGDITYVPLTIDAPPVNGEIPSGEQDYWQFTVVNDGYYGIQVWLGTLHHSSMSLHGPDDPSILIEEADSNDMSFFMIWRYLSAGTYYVKVNNFYLQYAGTYSINVVSVLAWGGISGRVTDASGVGIQGILAEVWGMDYYHYYGSAITDARGKYMISSPYTALATGSYKVYFYRSGLDFVSEWYSDKSSIETADLVSVISGGITLNVDAQLTAGNKITGRVTNVSGAGIQGLEVHVFRPGLMPDTTTFCSYGTTDANGDYLVWGLPSGDLKVQFYNNGLNYLSEWYNDKYSYSTADPVTVPEGSVVSGINAQLGLGDCISGRVSNSAGEGIRYVNAWVFDLDYNDYGWGRTDASGNYMLKGLPPGQYKIYYVHDYDGYFAEWYNDKYDFASADAVTVVLGSTTSHVDVQLESIITNPSLASVWEKGGAYAIKWQKQGEQNAYVKINLMKGRSTLVRTLTKKTDNDGSFDWMVPNALALGSNYFIKVKTIDNLVCGDSDKFSIIVPAIMVTAPASGTAWVKSTAETIAWSKLGMQDANVMIQLYKGTTKVSDISLSAPNNGIYNWLVPATLADGLYTIRITTLDGRVKGVSKRFTIADGVITVIQPATGAKWYRGMPWDISWTTGGAVNANVRIQLNRGATKVLDISPSTPMAGGTYHWTIPAAQAVAGNYSISVTALDNLARGKTANFSILSGDITVTQPAAGAVWPRGSTQVITWTKTGDLINAMVKIMLMRGTSVVSTLVSRTDNNGSFEWAIPAGQAPAANYMVRIVTADGLVKANSGVFTIAKGAGLTLLSPNGSERFDAATDQAIRWSNDPEVLEVKLEFSRDNGGSYTTIADHVPGTAGYDWTVPAHFTANGLVRVSDGYGKNWLDAGGVLEYTLAFNCGGREGAQPSDLILWFGNADVKTAGFGFAKVAVGGETVRMAEASRAIEPLAMGWHEAKILLDLRRDLGTLFIDGRSELENVPLYTSNVHRFEPYLSIQAGGSTPADLWLGGVKIEVVMPGIDVGGQERFTVLSEDFSGYDAERNMINNCWQVMGLKSERAVVELNTLPGLGRALRFVSTEDSALTIVKKLSIPEKIPFDISDLPFSIEMRKKRELLPDLFKECSEK